MKNQQQHVVCSIGVPPHNPEEERLMLSSLIVSPGLFEIVRDILTEDCFYTDFHRKVFLAIAAIDSRGETLDLVTVSSEMMRMGETSDLYEICRLVNQTNPDIYHHALFLVELSIRRKLAHIAKTLCMGAHDLSKDISDTIVAVNEGMENIYVNEPGHIFNLNDTIRELYKQIKRNHEAEGALTGIPTGFSELDKRSGGLQDGNLMVVAGETGSGKSSLAMKLACEAAKNGAPAAIYSLEMGKEENTARLLAAETGLPVSQILYGQFNAAEFDQLDQGTGKLMNLPIWFDDRTTSNVDTILASIRTMVKKHGVKVVIPDYIQILNVNMPTNNKEAQMGEISRRFKNLAKELNICIILISQFNRDRTRGMIDRLRDSGQISEAADIILTVQRHSKEAVYESPFEAYATEGTALLKVVKGRNIGTFGFIAGFDPSTTRFYEPLTLPVKDTRPIKEANPF